MGGGNHVKGVPLQGFKGFKLKGNCQILIKSNFKNATSKPIAVKKEEKVTNSSSNSIKLPSPKFSPPKPLMPMLSMLSNDISPAKKLLSNTNHAVVKEPVVTVKSFSEPRITPKTPNKDTEKHSTHDSSRLEERTKFKPHSNLSSSEISNRHRSPPRNRQSQPHDRHSQNYRKHSRSHDRRPHSSDERYSPKRRKSSDNREKPRSGKKRQLSNGALTKTERAGERTKHNYERRLHRSRSPEKHKSKKPRTNLSDGDIETNDLHNKSPSRHAAKHDTMSPEQTEGAENKITKTSQKPVVPKSAVPLASIGCWLDDAREEDEEDFNLGSPRKLDPKSPTCSVDIENQSNRNVFDSFLSNQQSEASPLSSTSDSNPAKTIISNDMPEESTLSDNERTSEELDSTSTEARLAETDPTDKNSHMDQKLHPETNSILAKLESELVDNFATDKHNVDAPSVKLVGNESTFQRTNEISECPTVDQPAINGDVENNITEDIQSSEMPSPFDEHTLKSQRCDLESTKHSPVGLFDQLNSEMPREVSPSSALVENSIQTVSTQILNDAQEIGKPSSDLTLQTYEQANNKPMLPAKKRCRDWFKSLAEEEKRKDEEVKTLSSVAAIDTVTTERKTDEVEVDGICNNTITETCPASPESPLFSPGSESPLQAPQMTAFDDLSSASGTEDYDPVVEIRIPIDGEENNFQENSKMDVAPLEGEMEENPAIKDHGNQEISAITNSELESDVVSDASMLDEGCRRSARIKTKQEKTKPRITSRLNCESAAAKPDLEVGLKISSSPIVDHMTSSINAVISNKIETGEISAEEKPPSFEVIAENIYLALKKKSRVRKEIRRMVCECANSEDDGKPPCGENCLNRLLMIECSSRCPFADQCSNKRFQRFEYEPTEVFRTSWKGWGLQASQAIGAGNLVMEYCGEVLDQIHFERRSQVYSMENQQHFYFMALSQDEIIDAMYKGNISRFINHSCDPNCETQKWTVNGRLRVGFFSIRNIDKGEEITFDYQFERYGKEAQKCYCGSSNCRGYLGKAPSENDELDDTKWKKWDTSLATIPTVDVELEKQLNKKKKKRAFADNTLESEIFRLRTGLQTDKDVLLLSRSMVRCDTMEQRHLCLKVLCTTENQACLRSFLQLHGLPLLWSWMVDLSATSTSDIDSTTSNLRIEILNTLSVLPITNKNILEDSKVLPMVKRWSEEEQSIQESMQAKKNDPEPVKEPVASSEQSNTADAAELTEPKSEQMETENDVPKLEVIPEQVNETSNHLELSQKISALTEKLLDLWKDLKEIYRIPKRQRSPIKMPPGGDSERSLEDRSSSQASSPSVGNHGDSNQGDWSARHHDNDRDKSPLRSKSRFDRDGGREWDKNRQRDGDKRGSRRSPTRRLRESESKYGRQSSNEREDAGKYSWLNESASRMSREEHRRQFERDARNREDDKKKHKDSSLAPSSGLLVWPQPANSNPSQAALGQQSILGNPPGVISALPDSATFTPSGYSGNLIQINPIPEPSVLPNPAVYTNQDPQQTTFAYAADSQVLLQNAPAAPPTFLPTDQQCQSITVIGAPAAPTQKPILHLEPTRTTPENFAAILHSFPQAATYPSGISVLASHANQAIVLLTTDQLNALLTNLPVPEPIVQQQPTLTVNPPGQVPAVVTNTAPAAEHSVVLPEVNDLSLEELSTVSETASKAASPPRDPRPPRLPPNWKTASDADGCVYYYHVITRQTQWDPPTWDGTEEDLVGKKEGEMDISSTPTSEDGVKKLNDKLTGSASIASDTESAKKSREAFRSQMSQHVVQCLSAYRKSDCKIGRITSTDDFKHLARKLTHNVLTKEIKQVQVWEDLECNANVKHKAKEYVRKYMAKCGPIYKGRDDDPR
uniref:[histone H3]-lysine(36) N-trimethyltransferase n=1 Tax=Phallusia mammillata TaxID=59560 RepID=A0A6F9DWB6_9ASCI|nr:histone-lysine N-methyltransferase NSD2 [Phallusia mammillata]